MAENPKLPRGTPKGELITWNGRTYTPSEWAELKKNFNAVTDAQFEEWEKSGVGNPGKKPKKGKP